jgi:hypothetical protein
VLVLGLASLKIPPHGATPTHEQRTNAQPRLTSLHCFANSLRGLVRNHTNRACVKNLKPDTPTVEAQTNPCKSETDDCYLYDCVGKRIFFLFSESFFLFLERWETSEKTKKWELGYDC